MKRVVTSLAGLVLIVMLTTSAARQTLEAPEAGEVPDVNDQAPDFELQDFRGETYRMSELRGKNVILEFIRSGSW